MGYIEKVVDLGIKWVKFPYYPYSVNSLPFLNHMVGFLILTDFLSVFVGFSILYKRYNPIRKHPINMYNNCSTLLYKYHLWHKKTHRLGGR